MNEGNDNALQIMVEYYRNKCSQLEHDFLLYKIQAERIISELSQGNVSRESERPTDPDAKN